MLIVNADDWGRSIPETDAALQCCLAGRVTSVSAMVFMKDSERAAELALANSVDVGLHLNFTERFSGKTSKTGLLDRHGRIAQFLTKSRYRPLLYNPALSGAFRYVYEEQLEEFIRLYGKAPTHVDGHQHQHLCANVLFGRVIPHGQKVRRSFYFWPGEKGVANRLYRQAVNGVLKRKYPGTDYFFALAQCLDRQRMVRVVDLARVSRVELMAHPMHGSERESLLSDDHARILGDVVLGRYRDL